ncbi:xenotropic and polytropic retrovirus receptor 1 homolog [Strongylocentrotus purpuratus]|uniref:Xenotropic and polytropic retrovirus receptor 1 n=1 Tax=Strongylocentrotus purpuratus TaxID=7668 RepID=A0A7M7T4H0_STRPU|nr:xenotropic and polytropic retrovirus receptor 1 homolog [Strongylocentrotus purpuratus]
MRFSEHLSAHITPEWQKQYIRYEELKNMLYDAQRAAPEADVSGEAQVDRHYVQFAEKFFQFCDKELSKINTFFSEKAAEASRNFAQLCDELRQVDSKPSAKDLRKNSLRRRSSFFIPEPLDSETRVIKSHKRKIADLKLAFTEFYLSLILLQNYQSLNFTGFRKILKKHDKMLQTRSGEDFHLNRVQQSPFHTAKQINNIIYETETLYINELEAGNRQRAMSKLRVPPLGAKSINWTTFRVGLFLGIFTVLCFVAAVAGLLIESKVDNMPAVRMYRGMFLIILMIFCLGLNTYGWRKVGVNHVLIFELDPRNNLSHEQLLEVALLFMVFWIISILAYICCGMTNIPPYINPLILAGSMLLFLINPTRTLNYRARFWLLRILGHIAIAPFHAVGFADFWLADQLNSLTCVLLDMEFLICYYSCEVSWVKNGQCKLSCLSSYSHAIRAVVACLPAWFRFAQCLRRYRDTKKAFPHLVNAGKYSTTFFVVLFSALVHIRRDQDLHEHFYQDPLYCLWIFSAFCSSCYTLTWDIKMDWGLLEKKSYNKLLRDEIVYPEKAYYFAMVEDLVLRFIWSVNNTVGQMDIGRGRNGLIISTILCFLEVIRRFIWNFFRLENEHLNNCGQFRAVRDISIKPAKEDENNPMKVEEMMDNEEFVPLCKHKPPNEVRRRLSVRDIPMVNNHACLSVPLLLTSPELIPKRPSVVRFQVGDNESGTSKTSIAQVGLYGEGSQDDDDDDENSSENSNVRDMLV